MLAIYYLLFHICFVWVVLRLVIPHLGFTKVPVPETVPTDIQNVIDELSRSAKNNGHFLEPAYTYVTKKHSGSRSKTVTMFWRAFQNPLYAKRGGFMPCTTQNYLLRTLLIKSGRFNESDIKLKVAPLNLFIHQYLKVNLGDHGGIIDVDPWSHFLGLKLGEKAIGFR